jgi:ATP-dependent protease ClpP protease subunit
MTNQKIKYVSDDSVFGVHSYDLDLDANQIYLFGIEGNFSEDGQEPGVEYVLANRFIRNLNIVMKSSDKPILIHMKTCGGYWEEGMAIYDAIKLCPNFVTILNYTHARSMSSIIFQAADKRVMMPHSTFMFHEGTFGFDGTQKQLRTEVVEAQRSLDQMLEIYIDSMQAKGCKSHLSRANIKRWLVSQMNKKEEVYLTAEDAVEYGFADQIFDGDWDDLLVFDDAE